MWNLEGTKAMYVSVELNSSSHVPANDRRNSCLFVEAYWKNFKMIAVIVYMPFDDIGVVMISWNTAGEKLEII